MTTLFEQQVTAKAKRDKVTHDFLDMLVRANIPIEKADHPVVHQVLSTHVKSGDAVPKSDSLHLHHLPALIEEQDVKLRKLADRNTFLGIITDETMDLQNRPVFKILFQILCPADQLTDGFDELLVKTVYNDTFLASNCPRLIAALNVCQSRKPQVQEVYNLMQDFTYWLIHLSSSAIDENCASAATAEALKLKEYMQEKTAMHSFLKGYAHS